MPRSPSSCQRGPTTTQAPVEPTGIGCLHGSLKGKDTPKGGIVTRPHVGLVGEAGPEAIIPLKKGGGGLLGGITVNAPISINGLAGGAPSDLGAILAEHARTIAREVQRVLAIQFEQEAVV
jgi:hypothetical protein